MDGEPIENDPPAPVPAPAITVVRKGGWRHRKTMLRIGATAAAVAAVSALAVRGCRSGASGAGGNRDHAQVSAGERSSASSGRTRDFVKDHIRDRSNCRVVSITKRNGDVVVCDRNDWAASGCPAAMVRALQDVADANDRIVDVTLTESGKWLVLHGRNDGAWRGIPAGLESALRTFCANDEEIYSATFNDSGDWIAISDEHYVASDGFLNQWLGDGAVKYGILRAACVTEDAAVAVFDGGFLFHGPVPEKLKYALRYTHLDVRIVKIAGPAWFFSDELGEFKYEM